MKMASKIFFGAFAIFLSIYAISSPNALANASDIPVEINPREIDSELEKALIFSEIQEKENQHNKIKSILKLNDIQSDLKQVEEETKAEISKHIHAVYDEYSRGKEKNYTVAKLHLLSTVFTSIGVAFALDTAIVALANKYKILPNQILTVTKYPDLEFSKGENPIEKAEKISLNTAYKAVETLALELIIFEALEHKMTDENINLFFENRYTDEFERLCEIMARENILHYIRDKGVLKVLWKKVYLSIRDHLNDLAIDADEFMMKIPDDESSFESHFLGLCIPEIKKLKKNL